jgi:hypothetical protein
MNHRFNPDADDVATARKLIAAAATGVKHLGNSADHAFYRLAALTGVLARLEGLVESHAPDAAEAAALDAAMVCRETKVLLHFIHSHGQKATGPLSPPAPRLPWAVPKSTGRAEGTTAGMK